MDKKYIIFALIAVIVMTGKISMKSKATISILIIMP